MNSETNYTSPFYKYELSYLILDALVRAPLTKGELEQNKNIVKYVKSFEAKSWTGSTSGWIEFDRILYINAHLGFECGFFKAKLDGKYPRYYITEEGIEKHNSAIEYDEAEERRIEERRIERLKEKIYNEWLIDKEIPTKKFINSIKIMVGIIAIQRLKTYSVGDKMEIQRQMEIVIIKNYDKFYNTTITNSEKFFGYLQTLLLSSLEGIVCKMEEKEKQEEVE